MQKKSLSAQLKQWFLSKLCLKLSLQRLISSGMYSSVLIMLDRYTLSEQEKQYLIDLSDYYKKIVRDPKRVSAQHPKPEAYGISSARARELIAQG